MSPSLNFPRQKTKTEIDRDKYQKELSRVGKRTPDGALQLSFFDALAANTPNGYTNIFEFFDAIPKFVLTPQTSLRKRGNLEIQRFEFSWGDTTCSVSIAPVVIESKDPKTKAAIRKEILPGPREETIYRVLKKMATDPSVERRAKETSVVLRFTLHQLRTFLSEVNHEYKVSEIKEALEVLNRSPLNITAVGSKKKLYSGPYIGLAYVSDETDETGQRTKVEVSFNDLAVAAVTAQLYDRIHFRRLMALSPLAAWIYELLTRNFRQAGGDLGYKLSLSRVMRESGLPPRKDLRNNLRSLRNALQELVEKGVLAPYPPYKEEVRYVQNNRRGRKTIEDVTWVIFPHIDVVKDIKEDNAGQAARRASQRQLR